MKLAAAALLAVTAWSAVGARTDFVEGNPASPVKVLIYEDLQCSDCANLRSLLDEKILPKYASRVAFIHRDFPLGKHDWARLAAIAVRWVYEQDPQLGITLRREILSEQNNISSSTLKPWLLEFAVRNHLDPKGIVAALTDQRLTTLVDQDLQAGVARGVKAVPAIYIGGVALVETIVYDDLVRALDEALAK